MQLPHLSNSFSSPQKESLYTSSWYSPQPLAMTSLLFLPMPCPSLGESFCTCLPGDFEDQSAQSSEWNESLIWFLMKPCAHILLFVLSGLLRGFVFSHSHWKFPYRRVRSAPEIVITEAPLKIFASHHRLREWTYGCQGGRIGGGGKS